MATDNIEMVRAVFGSISAGDADGATRHIDRERFVQHNPRAADGVDGLRQFIERSPREQLHLTIVRAFEDGPFVVTQAAGQRSGQGVFFDVFRFDGGLIVEHWAFSAAAAPPNQSGHTQLDGPTEATHVEDTERNKSFMRDYYETFHIAGDHSRNGDFFTGDVMVRHEPGVRDGLGAFLHDVAGQMQHRTIDRIGLILGRGDLVFIAAEGTHEGRPCVYVDLYRVEGRRVVEHWGFTEAVPPPHERRNGNGML